MLLCHAHLYMTFFSKWADDMLHLPTWCGSPSKTFSQPSEQDFRIRVKYIELQGCFIELEESSQKWHSLSGEGEVCKNLPINSYYYPRAFFWAKVLCHDFLWSMATSTKGTRGVQRWDLRRHVSLVEFVFLFHHRLFWWSQIWCVLFKWFRDAIFVFRKR